MHCVIRKNSVMGTSVTQLSYTIINTACMGNIDQHRYSAERIDLPTVKLD
jgi:hypothetical protein